jgi:type VI secretion system protein ImpK
MSQDDPFAPFESDRTLIIPTPGGRTVAPQPARAHPPPEIGHGEALPHIAGLNPLVAAANPLLDLVPQLRAMLRQSDPAGLRDNLVQGIRTFEARARAAGVPNERVIAARYVLCTLLDETAASTPWGGSGIWSKLSLLVTFHNEVFGGEKVFQLLAKLAEDPHGNRDLLEFIYAVLALGFEGRYRVIENGRAQLDDLRERLAQLLRNQRGEYERDLSPHWQGLARKRNPLLGWLPFWSVGAVAGVLLLGLYLGLSLRLNQKSDPAFAAIQSIRIKAPEAPTTRPAPVPAPAQKPRIAGFLEPEIRQGLVAVADRPDRSIVTIRGDGLFESGSATVSAKFEPLLLRIADALNTVPGQVLVTGHTDDQPIHSARFPSNWHLSEERAKSVLQLLASRVAPPTRLRAEGRGSNEPIAANDTRDNRARNRRVEITLLLASSGT